MKALGLQTISVAEIDAADRLRAVDAAHAAALAENIRQTGRLRQPIEVRTARKGGFKLIAGGHRLEAVRALGWTEVEAFVFDASDAEARLAEIDENLVRHDLNPLDRAVFLFERKAAYEALHPETKHGGDRGNQHTGGKPRQDEMISFWRSFGKDTAERIGLSERAIQYALEIAKKLSPEVRARIAGTWVAKKQSELRALVKVEPAKRLAVIDLLLAEDNAVTTVKAAAARVDGKAAASASDVDKQLSRLMTAWRHAGRAARSAFLQHLSDAGETLPEPAGGVDDEGDAG